MVVRCFMVIKCDFAGMGQYCNLSSFNILFLFENFNLQKTYTPNNPFEAAYTRTCACTVLAPSLEEQVHWSREEEGVS